MQIVDFSKPKTKPLPSPPVKETNNETKKTNGGNVAPPVPPKTNQIYPKLNNILATQIINNQNDNQSVPTEPIYEQKKTDEKNIEKIKRNKKKVQRITELEARQILETMVTPGDPYEKYILKDKLGSG